MPDSAHNCLIGCLLCQSVGPKNRGLFRREPAGESFNREESADILASAGENNESFRAAVRDKLAWAGLSTIERVLSRNLHALLAASALRTRPSAG